MLAAVRGLVRALVLTAVPMSLPALVLLVQAQLQLHPLQASESASPRQPYRRSLFSIL
jgi:hypothetical protein